MADRSRRARRQVSEMTEESPDVSEEESDSPPVRVSKSETSPTTSRAKRGAASTNTHITSSPDGKQSIKLTVKVAPSKLREVMRVNEVDSLRDTLGGGQVLDGPRSRRSATQTRATGARSARASYVEPRESDLDDEDEEEDNDDADADADADAEAEDDAEADEDTAMNDFDEVGAEAEGGTDEELDADEQVSAAAIIKKNQMPPQAPKITFKTPSKNAKSSKPGILVTPADVGQVQSVEDAEMDEDDDDDDDLDDESELPDIGEETNLDDTNLGGDTELGEDEGDEEDEELDDDDDGLGDSDEDELASGAATPDPSKLTSRQRGKAIEPLMALDMAPQQRKFFTEEEKAMKKDEHARKRKELTKRKIHEEKTAALNRLLKPQVSKTRGAAPKAETLAAQMQAAAEETETVQKADPLYTRWVSNKNGISLGVPEEWLGKKVGQYFGPPLPQKRKLVEEIE